MPEFVGSCIPEKDHKGNPLDSFTRSYFESMEFTGIDIPEELQDEIDKAEGGMCYDLSRFEECDWSDEALKQACIECNMFLEDNAEDIEEFMDTFHKDYSWLATTFWLNRNGHGSGFWEFDLECSKRLDSYCREAGERHVYFHKGKLYFLEAQTYEEK